MTETAQPTASPANLDVYAKCDRGNRFSSCHGCACPLLRMQLRGRGVSVQFSRMPQVAATLLLEAAVFWVLFC